MFKKRISKILLALVLALTLMGISDVVLSDIAVPEFEIPGLLIVFACEDGDYGGGQC